MGDFISIMNSILSSRTGWLEIQEDDRFSGLMKYLSLAGDIFHKWEVTDFSIERQTVAVTARKAQPCSCHLKATLKNSETDTTTSTKVTATAITENFERPITSRSDTSTKTPLPPATPNTTEKSGKEGVECSSEIHFSAWDQTVSVDLQEVGCEEGSLLFSLIKRLDVTETYISGEEHFTLLSDLVSVEASDQLIIEGVNLAVSLTEDNAEDVRCRQLQFQSGNSWVQDGCRTKHHGKREVQCYCEVGGPPFSPENFEKGCCSLHNKIFFSVEIN